MCQGERKGGDGIARARDEVAGDDGKVSAEIVGHIHGAAHLRAGHIAAEVDVANLHNLQAVEGGRQIGQGNLDAADLVVEALRGETVHGTEERSSSGSRGGGAEEVAGAALGATAIEAVLGVRSAKRECAISYVLGLDR